MDVQQAVGVLKQATGRLQADLQTHLTLQQAWAVVEQALAAHDQAPDTDAELAD